VETNYQGAKKHKLNYGSEHGEETFLIERKEDNSG
jgi:hypothetical protein